MDKYDRLLLPFDKSILTRYQAAPDRYRVVEDNRGGSIESLSDESSTTPWYQIRFAFRRQMGGEICVAAFAPDIGKLPAQESTIWQGYLITQPSYAQDDPAFEQWVAQHLDAEWQDESPRFQLEQEIGLVRALTNQTLGKPLMRFGGHDLLNYPVAENTDAYAKAQLELFRLVIDGLDCKVLSMLAERLGVCLTDRSKTLNSLNELLPAGLVSRIHEPLRRCAAARHHIHGVPSEPPKASPAFDTFHHDLEAVAQAVTELRKWLENVLGADARRCLKREMSMGTFLPKFVGPPRPESKLGEIKKAEGKTITRIEFGEERLEADRHQSEAIVIHFTDGSSMVILTGSNASKLSDQFDGLKPEDVSTDLVILWVPSIHE